MTFNSEGKFIPGLELSGRFYREAVRPILDQAFPGLNHAAALIGTGSDVLGFDDEMSTDHQWGPRMQIFLTEQDIGRGPSIGERLAQRLPHRFAGYPVNCEPSPEDPKNRRMTATVEGPVNHLVTFTTVEAFCRQHLGCGAAAHLAPADWLALPSQRLLEMTAGAVHHDGIGELTAWRARLAYYPHDVWIYLLAAGWQRIGQEEHLMPRAGLAGDELGSAVIGARLARDVMALSFLMERRYAPYPKWFGTAFGQLACAAELAPLLEQLLAARDWRQRVAALNACTEALARAHNRLALTTSIPETVRQFWGRPFDVIHGLDIAALLVGAIDDPEVRAIAERGLQGSVDQVSDSTDVRSNAKIFTKLKAAYGR